jgi:hypothetical protein
MHEIAKIVRVRNTSENLVCFPFVGVDLVNQSRNLLVRKRLQLDAREM